MLYPDKQDLRYHMIKNFELIIEGRVQGVGFRNFVYIRALKYNIKGYVKNTSGGDVEIYCSGESSDLDKFIEEVKKGPSFSFVTNIKIFDSPEINQEEFEIRY